MPTLPPYHRADLGALAASGDYPLLEIERHLRCAARGLDGRERPCGGSAKLYIHVPTVPGARGMHVDIPVLKPGA